MIIKLIKTKFIFNKFHQNPLENFNNKYPQNKKGKSLHLSLISSYSRQILNALAYLHEKNIYHLHLHSGNVLIDEKNNKIKITGLENYLCDFSIRNETQFNFLLDNSELFVDIFRSQFIIFEKFDLVSFGRILYEMAFGKELNCAYPDEIELKSIDDHLAKLFRLLFHRKESKNGFSHKISVPEFTAKDLLHKISFFSLNYYYQETKIKDQETKRSEIEEGIFSLIITLYAQCKFKN